MARTREADLGEALERVQAALLDLPPHQKVSEIAEAALVWALKLTGSSAAFVRLAGESPEAEQLFTRTSPAKVARSDRRLDDLLRHAADATGPQQASPVTHICLHPLRAGGRTFGVTGVTRGSAYSDVERRGFVTFANLLASALEVTRLQQSQGQTSGVLTNLRTELERIEHERQMTDERARNAERVERAHELAVAALLAVSVHASSGQSLTDFYQRLTHTIAELVDAKKVLFWHLDGKGHLAPMAGAHGVSDEFVRRLDPTPCTPDGDELASRVVFHDVVFRAARSDESQDFKSVLDSLSVEDAISVPWRAGNQRLGLVAAYDSERPEGFTREDTWVLQKAALAAGLVWQLKHAETDLQKSIERLQKVDAARQLLLKNVATAVDKTAKRFASELHDDALQKLTAVSLHLQRLKHLEGRDAATLGAIQDLLEQTEDSLRRLLFDVRPPALDEPGGLKESLRERLAMLHALTQAEVVLDLDVPDELSYQIKSMIFRQMAEALTNVEKHANARRVQISLKLADGAIVGVVQDDGQGFVVAERNNLPGHLGLLSLKERAILAGGWYKIESEPGVGTRIEFGMPVE
ncbi:MAG TPA: GAF domain-containing protein [Candidatus Dormibacteraeota bacterium]|nr:GAF domain-containing protein [Candidatus Dormibacteraeota bacterium]